MHCPSCSEPLDPRRVADAVDVHVCASCNGTLVPIPKLVPLLEALSGPLRHAISPDEPIEAIPDTHGRRPCPRCRRPMEAFGYLGTNLVTADRCSDDALIWTDAEELGTMAMLYLRTTKRVAERERFHGEMRESMVRTTRLTMSNRARANAIATGMLIGGRPFL
jgi:Zn-finger nucleic acid-binding protein